MPRRSNPDPFKLSRRELLVAQLRADGHTTKQVALALGLTYNTVNSYMKRVRAKYALEGRTAATTITLRSRLIEDGHLQEAVLKETHDPHNREPRPVQNVRP